MNTRLRRMQNTTDRKDRALRTARHCWRFETRNFFEAFRLSIGIDGREAETERWPLTNTRAILHIGPKHEACRRIRAPLPNAPVFSARELQVPVEVSQGRLSREIAGRLGLSNRACGSISLTTTARQESASTTRPCAPPDPRAFWTDGRSFPPARGSRILAVNSPQADKAQVRPDLCRKATEGSWFRLLESGAVALRKMATLSLRQNTRR